MRVIVLGAGAGGGLPQWNCGCAGCRAARQDPRLQRSQASLAVSADDRHWFLINAAPDLRQQLAATPRLHPPAGVLRGSPVAGVILTNAEIDAVAGLLTLREGTPYTLYAHPRVHAILRDNSIFNVLDSAGVRREPLTLDQPLGLRLPDGSPSGLQLEAFTVPGKPAWYLEGGATPPAADAGDTIGLRLSDASSDCYVITACAEVTPELTARLSGAALLFFDGTLWRDDELIAAGLGSKTGRRMGHIAVGGPDGAMAALAGVPLGRRVFLHINNSNPILLPGTAERDAVLAAGWEIAEDGMEIAL
jgi:pyrroloquinoline quinone biosynthesis protein B